jgi:hypothetical protein
LADAARVLDGGDKASNYERICERKLGQKGGEQILTSIHEDDASLELDEEEGEEAANGSQESEQTNFQCLIRIILPEFRQQKMTYVLLHVEPDTKQTPQQGTPCRREKSFPV